MKAKNTANTVYPYGDGDIPEIDLPGGGTKNRVDEDKDKDNDGNVEPLPESTRPRRDGPGGN